MIRILTSLVALFTVTSLQTQAALNQFSELLSQVVDAQKDSTFVSNLSRNTLAKDAFQKLIQRKLSFKKNINNYLFYTVDDSNSINSIFSTNTKRLTVEESITSSLERNNFHIRSPNLNKTYLKKDVMYILQ